MSVKGTVFIDFSRCVGCKLCEIACSLTHEGVISPNLSRIHVLNYNWFNIPLNCRHCEKAPCVEVCPTGALFKDEDGVVMINQEKCIGCKMCAIACPFGIPQFDEVTGVMFKCDLCADRIAKGELPACVEACPMDALMFGDINEIVANKRIKKAEDIGKSLKII
ncbi:formate dehydrogenase [Thermococcus profundus]|uniref:Formate dehydrogenase n=1 Tax=Thermococcus profundus TaxID=49899 RepID=A0A2Z2MCP1_THEPR|nr:4Fe-4S dicluster domain-containing protein [Thermococcus profundus]ASJ02345.1 formate dehydrogenase [Thermococcus profundus]